MNYFLLKINLLNCLFPTTDENNNDIVSVSETNVVTSRQLSNMTPLPNVASLGSGNSSSSHEHVTYSQTSSAAPSSHSAVMTTLAPVTNGMNNLSSGIAPLSIHNMTVPSSPGFLGASGGTGK